MHCNSCAEAPCILKPANKYEYLAFVYEYTAWSPRGIQRRAFLHENKPVTVRTQMSSGYQSLRCTCSKALAVVCCPILSYDAYGNLEMYESGIEGRSAFPVFRVN